MTDESCECESAAEVDELRTTMSGHWISSASAVDAALPSALQSALGQFVGVASVNTLGEWAEMVRRHTGGGAISVEELCHTQTETNHWGDVDGERYYFACFYDAVILATVTDQLVNIHTESPDGAVINARAVGSTTLDVSPPNAVFSFGIDDAAAKSSDGKPTLQDGYAALCPYVKAFPSREAYARWSQSVTAVTVAMPLDGATELAARLAA